MARKAERVGSQRFGWPRVHIGQFRPRAVATDDLVLAILWTLVIAGLVLLGLLAVYTTFGSEVSVVRTAEAAVQINPDEHSTLAHEAQAAPTGAGEDGQDQQMSGVSQSQDPRTDHVAACAVPDPVAGYPSPSWHIQAGPIEDVSASVGVSLGKVLESNLHSEVLDRDLPYRIYLPPGYDKGNGRYPVLYMLHGNGLGLWTEWTSDNRLGVIADALISTGTIQPMIIMMPDGEHSYFMNQFEGDRWQDYVLDEVIPFTDFNYRTLADRDHRAIGGHSMGGQAALTMAFLYPGMFVAVGAHSPSLHWGSEGSPDFFGPDSYFAQYNPLELARTAPNLNALQIWVDYGDQDPWLQSGDILDPYLSTHGVNHEWQIFPGAHSVVYWIEHGQDYLKFYSLAFAGQTQGFASNPC